MLALQICNGEKAAAPKHMCMCHVRYIASRAALVHRLVGSAAALQSRQYVFCPHRAPLCIGPMGFNVRSPYDESEVKQGEKRNGSYDDNCNVQKKTKKAPSAASLVIQESAPRPTPHEIHFEQRR